MPPKIRHAGPIALAVKGIREGAQAQFQAEERERLRKHRMALAELAEKKRQANIRRQMDMMQERGRMARQAKAESAAMCRQAVAGQQDMARQAMQARREQMGHGAQMERMREQQGMMGEREKSRDERAMDRAKEQNDLLKDLEQWRITELDKVKIERIKQKIHDLHNSPEADGLTEAQKDAYDKGLTNELWNAKDLVAHEDNRLPSPQQESNKRRVRKERPDGTPILDAHNREIWGTAEDQFRGGTVQTKHVWDDVEKPPPAPDHFKDYSAATKSLGTIGKGALGTSPPSNVIHSQIAMDAALRAGKPPDNKVLWELHNWRKQRALNEADQKLKERRTALKPLLSSARTQLQRRFEHELDARLDARTDLTDEEKELARAKSKQPYIEDDVVIQELLRDPATRGEYEQLNNDFPAMEGLKERYPILRDDSRPEGAAEGPDPTRILSQQGGQPQQGVQLPQGGQPPQGGPPQQGMQLPQGGIPEQPQAPTVGQRVQAYLNTGDPNAPPPQFIPTNTLPQTEQLEHNQDIVNAYYELSSNMRKEYGTDSRYWPQKVKNILADLNKSAIDETPPQVSEQTEPEVELPPGEPTTQRGFMRPTGSSELVKGLPPGGWGSHSETISVSEYQHLSGLDEYPLRNSLDRMTSDQKTGLQKLAVTYRDERLVEAMESPSWLKLGSDGETTQAAEQMEELVRKNVKPLSKWTKADREKFSVLHREVTKAIGKFHGVDSGGSISEPAVVAKRIRAHLKQVGKWNAIGEEEARPLGLGDALLMMSD